MAAATLGAPPTAGGRGAEGTGGLPGTFGAGLEPTAGGAGGFGLLAIGGGAGLLPITLDGLELDGESSAEDAAGDFFQGAADPFADAIPGNTATGLAFAFALRD